jgi:hypothetical protein
VRNTLPRVPSKIITTATVKATMFSNLTSILTMTAMLLHSILGCCAHHAHACEHGQSAEKCQAVHVGHHADEAENARAGHPGEGHAGCTSQIDDGNHGCRHDADGTQVSAHEEHDSSKHPQGPCQQNCDGGDCRFTQSPEVKTPSLEDGRLCCPSASAAFSMAPSVHFASEYFAADSGRPRTLATGCCRPMTQVWRL